MDQNSTQEGLIQTQTEEISAQDVLEQQTAIGEEPAKAEEPEVEAKTEEEEVQEKESEETKVQEDRFAAKFAALSRKEKAIREREALVERRMAEIEAKLESLNKPEPEVEEEPFEIMIRKNPMEALKKYGLDYQTLTELQLNDGKLTPEMQIKLVQEQLDRKYSAELATLKKELEEKEKRAEEERHNQVINGFKTQIRDEVSKNVSEYELLSVEGDDGIDLVYDVIEEHYNETDSIMNVKEAAALVEDYLLEEAKKRVNLSKIKKLLGTSEESPKVEPKESKDSVTLSNSQSQTSKPGERFLSDEESKREVAKLIKWTED